MYTLFTIANDLLINTTAFTTTVIYIDPSVMTQLIQAVSGIVIAVGVGVGVYFHKIKRKVKNTMNIDTQASKEVEDELEVYDDTNKKD